MAKRRARKGSYKLTSKRRVALKRAQAISAQKRKGQGFGNAKTHNGSGRKMNTAAMGGKRKSTLGRNIAIGTVGVTAISAAGIVARHKLSGSSLSREKLPIVSANTGNIISPSSKISHTIGRHNGGVTVNVFGKKSGPLGDKYRYTYEHKNLGVEQVLGKKLHGALTKKRSAQPWFESMASVYTPDRGQNRRENPKNPGHNFKGERLPTQNWVYGKRGEDNTPAKIRRGVKLPLTWSPFDD